MIRRYFRFSLITPIDSFSFRQYFRCITAISSFLRCRRFFDIAMLMLLILFSFSIFLRFASFFRRFIISFHIHFHFLRLFSFHFHFFRFSLSISYFIFATPIFSFHWYFRFLFRWYILLPFIIWCWAFFHFFSFLDYFITFHIAAFFSFLLLRYFIFFISSMPLSLFFCIIISAFAHFLHAAIFHFLSLRFSAWLPHLFLSFSLFSLAAIFSFDYAIADTLIFAALSLFSSIFIIAPYFRLIFDFIYWCQAYFVSFLSFSLSLFSWYWFSFHFSLSQLHFISCFRFY